MCYYIIRTSKGVRDAAIAQQVERILGKDEVTSSNLVSSSKRPRLLLRAFCVIYPILNTRLPKKTGLIRRSSLVFYSQLFIVICYLSSSSLKMPSSKTA